MRLQLFGRIYLWLRWLMQTADESGPLSGLTSETPSSLSESTLQDGISLPQPDIDTRPVGRCFNEAKRLKNLITQAQAVDAAMKDALTAFWACRDAAAAAPAAQLQQARSVNVALIFDSRSAALQHIERQLETPE